MRVAFQLTAARNGIRGRLELVEDSRLTPDVRSAFLPACCADPCPYKPQGPFVTLCASLSQAPLLIARVRVVDSTGGEVISRGLELPFADMSAHRLRGDGALAYFVNVDLGVGMGSFNGPITRIAEVRRGWHHWLSARHMPGDVVTETGLMTSLKTAWKLVPGRSGRGQDVLLHACRPRFDTDEGSVQSGMELIYSRYLFEDGEWRRYERREPGSWENEGTFPPRSSFP